MLAADIGQTCWPVPFNKGEVEHVHHTTQHQLPIACAPRHEFGYYGSWRVVEYHTVEHAVEDVACSSGRYHRHADEVAPVHAPLDLATDVPDEECDCNDAERSEEPLVENLHAESHSIVLGKENLEPVGDTYALVQVHAGLDGHLDGVVDSNNTKPKDSGG